MLHQSKSESIIGWFNASTMMKKDTSIQSIAELSDGKKFIVLTSIVMDLKKGILPDDSESNPINETNNPNPVSMDVKVDDVIDNSETDIDVEENVGKTVELSPEPTKEMVVEKEGNSNQADELEVQTRFDDIKKFIDGFLNQDSSSIIVYPECIKGKELELAKVAVLLLSALAQSYLSFNIELYLNYLIVLNPQTQEDIKDCMTLIVESDEPLKKTDLQKILSRPSKSKFTPRRRTSTRGTSDVLETPENHKSLNKKKQSKANMPEEIYESPLKALLDSPKIQLKTSLYKKDVEISKLREHLHIEECKVIDLTIEKRSLNAELEKKKRELEFLKEDRRRVLESAEEVDTVKSIKLEEHLAEKQKDNQLIHELKEELDILKKENEKLNAEIAIFEKRSQKDRSEEANFKQMNLELIEKVKELELNIDIKNGKIKDLKQKLLSLESDNKMYRQMLEETNKSVTPKASPKCYESVNIIYADARDVIKERDELSKRLSIELEQVKTWKKCCKEAEAAQTKYKIELEKKDAELASTQKMLSIYEHWSNSVGSKADTLSNASEEVASENSTALASYDDTWPRSSPVGSEREKSVKEEPEISNRIWDNFGSVGTRSRSANSLVSCTKNEFLFLKRRFNLIATKMNDKLEASDHLKHLVTQSKLLNSFKDINEYLGTLSSLIDSLNNFPSTQTKRKSRSQTSNDGDINGVLSQNKNLENELENMKHKMIELQKGFKFQLEVKTNELRLAEEKCKALELNVQELKQKFDKSQQDLKDANHKLSISNRNYQLKLTEQKQLLKVCKALKNEEQKSTNEPCKDCQVLHKKLFNMKQDRNEYEREASELKAIVKELESKVKNLETRLKNEIKEKQKLEFQIQRESSFLSGSISDKRAVIHRYFQQGLAESKKAKERKLEAAKQPQVVSLNTYILNNETKEPCPENSFSSTFANRSIRSGFLQTDDEEDFLNHSSLAQIQRETEPDEPKGRRLTEIRRRNTLCLPHLKSSYPLELQNMTPTERKYFHNFRRPQPVGDDTDSELAIDSEESNDVSENPVNKRKASDMGNTFMQPVKKQARAFPIKQVPKEKEVTPVRKTGLLYKAKTFKTPSSIRRLMKRSSRIN